MTNILRLLTEELRENIYNIIRMRNVYLQVTNAVCVWAWLSLHDFCFIDIMGFAFSYYIILGNLYKNVFSIIPYFLNSNSEYKESVNKSEI
jgi:hypothetical protein